MLDLISYGGLYQCIGTLWNRVIHLSCFNHPLLTDTACCWNIGSWLSCDKCLYSYSVLSKFVVVWVHCTAHCIVLHRFPLWKKLAFIEERSVWYMSSWYVHFLLCILLQNFYIYVLLLYIIYIVINVVFWLYCCIKFPSRGMQLSACVYGGPPDSPVIGVYVQQVAIYIYKISWKVYFGSSAFCDLNLNF